MARWEAEDSEKRIIFFAKKKDRKLKMIATKKRNSLIRLAQGRLLELTVCTDYASKKAF